MKITITDAIKDYEGKEIPDDDGFFTVRKAIILALNTQADGEIMKSEDKNRVFQISSKLWHSNEVDLSVKERAFILDRAGRVLTPLAYGRLGQILEGDDINKDSELPEGEPESVKD